jgi:hypothetical protein
MPEERSRLALPSACCGHVYFFRREINEKDHLYHIRAKQTRRYKVTTKRNKAHPVAPNLLKRDFTADDGLLAGPCRTE